MSRSPAGVTATIPERGKARSTERSVSFGDQRVGTRPSPNRLGVVHLTSEYWPLARTGGLGEAVSGLANVQAASGMPTIVVMPLYRTLKTSVSTQPVGAPFTVEIGSRIEAVRVFRLSARVPGPQVYFIDHPESFDRPDIYGDRDGDYPDNARRFSVLAHAALAALPAIAPSCWILHAHDWHTALAPIHVRTALAGEPYYDRLATVLSVHNAGFQGHLPEGILPELGLPEAGRVIRALEWYGRVNLLKGGLTFSDAVVTVSPSHADELCTPEGGFGLHGTFRNLGGRLVGILNGIDLDEWNPETDPLIAAPYSLNDLGGKRRCKAALQRTFGLAERPDMPLVGMSARLVTQKGLDLILGGGLIGPHAQFVFLGHGEPRFENALTDLARTSPDRIGVQLDFTDRREHELMAGADVLLMPSMYEPCGLAQMRAQRYGTVPLARRTGGLADTIEDGITGFLFDQYSQGALEQAAHRALAAYREADHWPRVVRMGMRRRFSWRRAEESYRAAYHRALALHTTAQA